MEGAGKGGSSSRPTPGCVQEERKTKLKVTFPPSRVSPRGPSTEPDKDDGLNSQGHQIRVTSQCNS